MDLVKLISPGSPQPIYPPLRSNVARAFNFLQRTGMDYRLVPLTPGDIPTAMDIVRKHFEMIEAKGKLVGSTFDDYLGLLHPDLQSLKSVSSYLGILGSLPISVFICESNGLEELAKVCAELVVLREEFLMISKRYAMLNNAWNATLQDKGVINAPPQP